jgi:glucokinase
MGWLPFLVLLVVWPSLRDPASGFVGHDADSVLHRSEDAGIIRIMHTAGIDLGGTKIQGVVVDRHGRRLGEARGKTPVQDGAAAVVAEIAAVVKAAAKDAKVAPGKLTGIGIGSPGRMDRDSGKLFGAANVFGFHQGVPLGAMVAEAVGVERVVVDNDVVVATLAEHRLGAGRSFDDLLTVFAGSGIGGALILGGQLRVGAHGAAGEIGHMVVVDGGELCPCGRRGCAEAYAGRNALERAARAAAAAGRPTQLLSIQERRGRPRMTSGVWKAALDAGDPLAHELIDRAVEALGAAIASAVNLVDVQAVLIGGGLGDKLGEPFVRRVETAMIPHLFLAPDQVEVRLGALGDYAGATGAALLLAGT